jgi:hypothetical protein
MEHTNGHRSRNCLDIDETQGAKSESYIPVQIISRDVNDIAII